MRAAWMQLFKNVRVAFLGRDGFMIAGYDNGTIVLTDASGTTKTVIAQDDEGQKLLGMLALEAPWIRQFAVFPEFQRRGIGSALLRSARDASPSELRLFTFQRNVKARAFYEKHGFAAVAFGRSPAPELEPDVEYRFSSDTHRRGIDARSR